MVTCEKCGTDYEDYATYCNECKTALVDEGLLESPEGSAFSWLDLMAGIATLLAVLSAIFLHASGMLFWSVIGYLTSIKAAKRSSFDGVRKRNIASWINLLVFSIVIGSLLIGPILTFFS